MVGQTVGKYQIVSRLGRGGMGTVYKAVDATLDREVAIKSLNADLGDPDLLKRFRAEAITLARLNHPNIATLFELTEHEGQLLMVMEFVRGDTFDKLSQREGPMPLGRAAQLCGQVLDALAHAHRGGIVHRDLKPSNLMLTESGLVKVMDFGLARMIGTEHLTNDGYMVGTPAYMSPEQVLGREIDGRADLYAMGVVLFRLLTGQLPFKADSGIAMVHRQLNDPPTPVRQLRGELSATCESVIARALAKPAGDRYQTAEEFRAALSELDPSPTTGVARTAPTVSWPAPVSRENERTLPATPTPMAPAAMGLLVSQPRTADAVSGGPATSGVAAQPSDATISPANLAARKAGGRNAAVFAAVGAAVLLVAGISGVFFWRAHRVSPASSAPAATAQPAAAAAVPQTAPVTGPATPPSAAAVSATPSTPAPPTVAGRARAASAAPVAAASAPPVKSAEGVASARPSPGKTTTPAKSAAAPPVAAAPPAAPAPEPVTTSAPAPVVPAPPPPPPAMAFERLKLLTLDEDEERTERDVALRLGADRLEVVDGTTPVHAAAYTQVIGVFYSHGKDPRWTMPDGRSAPVMKGGGGPMSFMRAARDWITVRTAAAFFPLRVPAEDVQRMTAALEARTGLKVLTAK